MVTNQYFMSSTLVVLLNNDVSKSEYKATNNRVTIRKERATKLPWPIFSYYSTICLEGLRKATNRPQDTSSSAGLKPGYVSSWTIRNQTKNRPDIRRAEQGFVSNKASVLYFGSVRFESKPRHRLPKICCCFTRSLPANTGVESLCWTIWLSLPYASPFIIFHLPSSSMLCSLTYWRSG
jgi:hypothetical protein